MKHILLPLFFLCVLLGWGCTTDPGSEPGPDSKTIHPFEFGSGTEEDPYGVATIDQLQAIDDTLYLDKHFIQTGDIDASASAEFNNGEALHDGFNPIGDVEHPFTGSYNGGGYLIENLYLKFTRSYDYNGLFGYIKNARLENINVDNREQVGEKMLAGKVAIKPGRPQEMFHLFNQAEDDSIERGLAGLAGVNKGGVIRNCHFRGGVGGYIGQGGGGLVGVNTGLIEFSSFEGKVTYDGSAGLVGWNIGEIRNSHASVRVSGQSTAGFVSTNEGSIIESYSEVESYGTAANSGFVHNNFGRIESSFAIGTVYGIMRTAGLVMENSGYILDSYSQVSLDVNYVTGFEELYLSHLVVENHAEGIIETSYAAGLLNLNPESAIVYAGGVVAENDGELLSVYWDKEITEMEKSIGNGSDEGATGLNTSQMIGTSAQENMPGFDWMNVWTTTSDGYPILRWQVEED